MYQGKKVLAIIPARGGSKGIRKKNLQEIGNRSLVEWALFVAEDCDFIDRIIVTSDDEDIIRKIAQYGDYAPFFRPKELARDETPSLPVFQHALAWSEPQDACKYDSIIVLEPTCPFRLPMHIKRGVKIAVDTRATSVVSMVQVGDYHPIRVKRLGPNGQVYPFCIEEPEGLRRQDQDVAYIRNGAVYVFSRSTIMSSRLWGDRPYGFEMERRLYSINIDEEKDLYAANQMYEELLRKEQLHLIDTRHRFDNDAEP